MSKRFTETDIWKNQRWFRKLPANYKLAWGYIKDQCNHAGIWRIDCTDLIEDLTIKDFDLTDFITACNTEYDKITGEITMKERLKIVNKTFLWITGFIQFQYEGKDGKINISAAPVRTALQILEGLDKSYVRVTEGLGKGYGILGYALHKGYIVLAQPLPEGYLTPKDKEKDKEKKGGTGENKIKPLGGAEFDEDKNGVFFPDGSYQELGELQKEAVQLGRLIPNAVIKGAKY